MRLLLPGPGTGLVPARGREVVIACGVMGQKSGKGEPAGVAVALCCVPLAVCDGMCTHAQHAVTDAAPRPAPVAPADPLNPQAQVPAAVYVSPLSTYRRLGEDKRVPWTQANETVNRIGGWRSYAREAQQPDTAVPGPVPQVGPTPVASTAPGAAASVIPSPAPGHRGHGLR